MDTKVPEVHYARSGEVSIAYQVVGDGPRDIVFVRGSTGDLLSTWEQPLLLRGEAVRGIAVHIGARIASIAGPGEVLVSSTVRDLVAGSGLEFEERGDHELKGVPHRWRLFRVAG